MPPLARRGDLVIGGVHKHECDHDPRETRGRIVEGATKVFADGRPVARAGDRGYSPLCCEHFGEISILPCPGRVFIEGRPAVAVGNPTLHCGKSPGVVASGSSKVSLGT